MKNQELQNQVDNTEELIEQGKFNEAETLCYEILSNLPDQSENAERWRETLTIRSNVLRFLAWALRETDRHTEALEVAELILAGAKEAGSKRDEAIGCRVIGYVHRARRNHPAVLEYFHRALTLSEEIGDRELICRSLNDVGAVYCDNVEDYTKALDMFSRALAIGEELGINYQIAASLENIGVVYTKSGMYDQALEWCGKALAIAEELGSISRAANMTGNIGVLYYYLGDYSRAMEFFIRSLAMYKEQGNKAFIALQLGNIGEIYSLPKFDGYDPAKAEEYLMKAIAQNEEIGIKPWDQYRALAEMERHEKRWENSDTYFRKYHQLEKESSTIEIKKKAEEMEREKQAAEREKILSVERERSDVTTKILHQVLPPSIADRLIKGEKVADYFSQVSILFADIVGFTPIASKMPARKVLAFLNYVFGEFDRIIEKHGCEKIKTIGDGYMAVAGAPIECPDHAERIARAAVEMMGDIQLPEDIRSSLPKDAKFNIRIGINIGPAFGGIVGEKRFVYDIYSDAVNTAARMESHGEPGKIHVSEEFAFHLQNRMDMMGDDLGGIIFEEREEIEIKGKGMMKTYFLEAKQ
ncbi:MAG: tetratricopeptide repeat protein [Ignavibacteria bacterium]|nr:tetratricopeptide repeat protein [Ignavibacteria bacterium]